MTHDTVTLWDHVTHTRFKSQESERTTYGHRQRNRHGPGRVPGQPDPAWHTEEGAGGGTGLGRPRVPAAQQKQCSRTPVRAPPLATCSPSRSPWAQQPDVSTSQPGRAQARATACLTRRDLSKRGANTLRWEICLKIQTLAAASVTKGLGATETHRHRHPPAPAGTVPRAALLGQGRPRPLKRPQHPPMAT